MWDEALYTIEGLINDVWKNAKEVHVSDVQSVALSSALFVICGAGMCLMAMIYDGERRRLTRIDTSGKAYGGYLHKCCVKSVIRSYYRRCCRLSGLPLHPFQSDEICANLPHFATELQ